MTCSYDYRWATGYDVALINLVNVETNLFPYARNYFLPPKTQPLKLYPIRRKVESGRIIGNGRTVHIWHWDALPVAALNYIEDTYITTGGVQQASKPMTVYTRQANQLNYIRVNVEIELPQPDEDYTYDRGLVFNLNLKLHVINIL